MARGPGGRPTGAIGTSSDPGGSWDQAGPPWEDSGPPWEVPGWDEADADLPYGHPSGPMSADLAEGGAGGHPSMPTQQRHVVPGEPPGQMPYGRGDDLTGGHPSWPLPAVSSAPLPTAWSDTIPPVPSGALPPASTGPQSRVSTGPQSRASTGPQSRVSTGPQSRVSTGPPSGPLPPVSGEPLAPLPPSQRGWSQRPAGDYPDHAGSLRRDPRSAYPSDRYQGGGEDTGYPGPDDGSYRGRHGQSGYQPTEYGDSSHPGGQYGQGGYQGGGYPDAGYGFADSAAGHPDAAHAYPEGAPYPEGGAYPDTAAGYADDAPGYPDDDSYPPDEGYYGRGGYRAGDPYPGQGGDPGYAGGAGYPDSADYPGGGFRDDRDEYRGYPAGAHVGQRGDERADRGYDAPGNWYGDVDDEQDWADEGYGDGFLPGLGTETGARGGREGGRGRERAPYEGRPRPEGGGRGRKAPGRRKRGVRRAAPWIALTVIVLLLATAGGAYYYVYRTYLHPPDYSGSGQGFGTVKVTIYHGDTATAVGQRLFELGVVASARAFANAAKASGRGNALEPGVYLLHKHMNAKLAFSALLSNSSRVQAKVTIREGLRLSSIIAVLGEATHDPVGYQKAISDTSKLGLPSFARGKPEGYLFPDTYTIQPGTPPLKVLQEMVAAFKKEAASVNLPAAAAKGFLKPADVITVASLVEAEGGKITDYPKIAEVIYNRLNQGMPLQLDSTVLFAVRKYGILATAAQLKVKSPYNTYTHTGLPPGPIDSPGDAAIKAALHPDHGNLMYFVTVNPKTRLTKFTSSYAQFQRYQQQLRAYLAKHP